MKISIIIAVYNDPELTDCLNSVFKSENANYEVIVVDDGSTTVDIKKITEKYPLCKTFIFEKNNGPSVARNYGAKQATGEIIFFLDSDAQLYPDTLKKITKHFENDSSVDGVTIIYSDEPLKTNFLNKFKAIELNYNYKNVFSKVFGSNGSAIYKKIFLSEGGFDENFKTADAEDFYLGQKIFNKGYKIILDKETALKNSFVDQFFFQGLKKYCRRAFLRALVLYQLKSEIETSYNTKKFKLLYLSSVLIFILILLSFIIKPALYLALLLYLAFYYLNKGLYSKFKQKYGLFFWLRAIITHYFYILLVTISGGLGLIYGHLFKEKNSL